MIRTGAASWQVTLADLSLILFMVTLAGISVSGKDSPAGLAPEAAPEAAPIQALYRSTGAAAPDFGDWLAMQQVDDRMTLAIHIQHPAGDQAWALAQAQRMMAVIQTAAIPYRLQIEPGRRRISYASLGFDGQSSMDADGKSASR